MQQRSPVLAILIVTCVGVVSSILFSPCENGVKGTGTLRSVDVSSCPGSSSKCLFRKGEKTHFNITFTTGENAKTYTIHVSAILGGVPVPFLGYNTDGCAPAFKVTCPLTANTDYVYQSAIEILPLYPTLDTDAKFHAKDANNQTIFCFLANVSISS